MKKMTYKELYSMLVGLYVGLVISYIIFGLTNNYFEDNEKLRKQKDHLSFRADNSSVLSEFVYDLSKEKTNSQRLRIQEIKRELKGLKIDSQEYQELVKEEIKLYKVINEWYQLYKSEAYKNAEKSLKASAKNAEEFQKDSSERLIFLEEMRRAQDRKNSRIQTYLLLFASAIIVIASFYGRKAKKELEEQA